MKRVTWNFGKRYELSGDGIGLRRYISPRTYFHIHSNEMISMERWIRYALWALKGEVRYC